MRKKILLIFLMLLTLESVFTHDPEIHLGVLSNRSDEITLNRWSATADYLNEKIPGYRFSVIPVGFEEIDEAIAMKSIDFILANTGLYVELASRYDISRIVTMKNDIQGRSYTSFGGVFFTRSDRDDIKEIKDMRGKTVASVARTSLGGWIALWRELDDRHIKPESYFSQIGFLDSHDEVVYAVRDGLFDGGTVRTDTLESMANENLINLDDYKLIQLDSTPVNREIQDFPYLLSTRLYPEWPLAKLSHVPNELAEQLATSLIVMPPDSPAAVQAGTRGWTIPLNYQIVHDCFYQLKIGPYENYSKINPVDVISKYLLWIIFIVLIILFLISTVLYILSLNRQLKESERKMRQMATLDPLTELPNRRYFQDFAEKTLDLCRRRGCRFGIYYMDLDRFKPVNDQYGHETGDMLLHEVGQRLIKQMRKSDLCARIGGDEFVALIQDVKHDQGFDKVARRILESLSHPYFINEKDIKIGVSIGISLFPEQGRDLEALLKMADEALYHAKEQGKGRYRIYREG